MKLLVFVLVCVFAGVYSRTPESEQISKENIETLLPSWMVIYPGTKWCGDGAIAANYDDMGDHPETDLCCRDHDFCPDFIYGGESKYNLTNDAFYTKVSCECDRAFYNCLKSANSETSNGVGTLYFSLLGTECFENNYPIQSCKKYSYFPTERCLEYEFDETQEPFYQWFMIPNY